MGERTGGVWYHVEYISHGTVQQNSERARRPSKQHQKKLKREHMKPGAQCTTAGRACYESAVSRYGLGHDVFSRTSAAKLVD
jgi:hypothetical protein